MSRGFYHEHCFTEFKHVAGSNQYSFNFPGYWRETTFSDKTVQLRRLNITPSARDFTVSDVYLKSGDKQLNISFRISLASGEGMETFNDRMERTVSSVIEEYRHEDTSPIFDVRDYEIVYNFSKSQLIFNVLSPDDGSGNVNYFFFSGAKSSPDFDAITGVNCTELFTAIQSFEDELMTVDEFEAKLLELGNVEVQTTTEGGHLINRIVFNNVWSRSTLFVTSSLSETNELQYLGLSNEVYNPPKRYDVRWSSSKLEIGLMSLDRYFQVELPADGKDRITIEVILTAS